MATAKKIIIIIGFVVIFTLGYSLGNEDMPFNDTLKVFYQDSVLKKSDKNFESVDEIFYETDVKELINIQTEDDIRTKKSDLINHIWKESIIPQKYDRRYDD